MLSDDSIQSEYFDYPGDLKKWGYGSLEYDDYYDFKWSIPIKKALENIGVSAKKKDEGGPNRAWNWEHESEVTIDGKKYLPTGATFLNIFNPEDGVIIAWGNYGPAYRAKKKDPPIELLPKLQKWSDVAFLQWYATSGKGDSTKNINYILQTPIENEESVSLIERALANTKKELKTWPGVEFDAESDEGKAILGSPNGSGIGFFLTQHKKWLGNKMVVKLTVFQDDGVAPRPPSVIFHIEESC
ncbi:hypothetical protein BDV95DRAFT_560268 [Massariosphaeria phaeospora]|uniref:Uncharacterized protein n=1 Tax=Massariosphaeria phaeospora TaxID=100035 RepID=A0A7C8MLG3_9PLEO|nr:hypothetical protein BDV95DRAFT_560268 [Massariosphaeria phaeospora]